MVRSNPNKSFFHFRADFYDDNENITMSKYYLTVPQILDEFKTSTYTFYKMLKSDYIPNNEKLKSVKFFRDRKQAMISVQQDRIIEC